MQKIKFCSLIQRYILPIFFIMGIASLNANILPELGKMATGSSILIGMIYQIFEIGTASKKEF